MSGAYSNVVATARDYYNSDDADNFYFHVWGGEDIHIGIYTHDDEPIATASARTVQTMMQQVASLNADSRVIDVGAGYGGAARALARRYGCKVTCLNLSEAQNARNRELNREQGLDHLVDVVDGSFEHLPMDNGSFDLAWSQDAILHSGNRAGVLAEINRVLRPGGEFIFTDPMQADDCPAGVLGPVLARIHLDTLGSFGYYRRVAQDLGWREVVVTDLSEQLPRHYARVQAELGARRDELTRYISAAYIDRMLQGLSAWIDAGRKGYLAWGIMRFQRR
ncbi:MAG: methyltransferase domain-containing protein [Gammaproteobacteria bacterium]|nr:methyltransferase domain-containing protein [Gammaproteobacteria bacterium]